MRMCAQEESTGTLKAVSLKILMVGSARGQQVRAELARAGHSVVSAPNLIEALEALLLQSFAAVLLADDVPPAEMEEVAAAVHELDRRAGGQDRIPVLLIEPQGRGPEDIQSALQSGIDGIVPESIDADALTLAIARLAAAVSHDKGISSAALAPELPVLRVQDLREQVAFDDELLAELIDLYISERAKQSSEMKDALAKAEWERLSRVAHTIKGSLGSLHAAAAHATAQSLEMAARDRDAVQCEDFLLAFETQLDLLEQQLIDLRRTLRTS